MRAMLAAAAGGFVSVMQLGQALRERGAAPPAGKLTDALRALPGLRERRDPLHGQHAFALDVAPVPTVPAPPAPLRAAAAVPAAHVPPRAAVATAAPRAIVHPTPGTWQCVVFDILRAARGAFVLSATIGAAVIAAGVERPRGRLSHELRALPWVVFNESHAGLELNHAFALSQAALREPLPPPQPQPQPRPPRVLADELAAWPLAQRRAWEAAVAVILRRRGSRFVAGAVIAQALGLWGVHHPAGLTLTQCLRALPWVAVRESTGGDRAYAVV